jgi:hypothetical protein
MLLLEKLQQLLRGGKDMCLFKKWKVLLPVMISVAVMTMLLALSGGSPMLAQEDESLYIYAPNQDVVLLDSVGNQVGSGHFKARVFGRRDGQAAAQSSLKLGYILTQDVYGMEVDIGAWYVNEDDSVTLTGRGLVTYPDGSTEPFLASVTVRRKQITGEGGEGTIVFADLVWIIPPPAILGDLNFETERSQLRVR